MWEIESAKQGRCRTFQEKIMKKALFKKLKFGEIKYQDT